MGTVLRYDGGRLVPAGHEPVEEVRFTLCVNGTAIARLAASPHDLQYLVTGFLRLRGLVRSAEDFLSLRLRPESGRVDAAIRGGLPAPLDGAATFGDAGASSLDPPAAKGPYRGGGPALEPGEAAALAESAARLSAARAGEETALHHAAAGRAGRILLYAEDVGRSNTVARVAGEATLRQVDLSGALLCVSGRAFSETAAAAALLGIAGIVSAAPPTAAAARHCSRLGIALFSWSARAGLTVHAGAHRLRLPGAGSPIAGVTGVILAGGRSARMGSEKALLPCGEGRFIEAIHRRMAALFEDVLVVTNHAALFDFLPCRKVPDLVPGMGALSGIHSGLVHSSDPCIFVVACDMPYLDAALVRHLASARDGADAVVPHGERGPEPLHAIYGKGALPAIEAALRAGEARLGALLDRIRVRTVPAEEVALFDPSFASFRNINTPEDYFRFREEQKALGTEAACDREPSGKDPGGA